MTNPYNHPRGTICVARETEGALVALKIMEQRHWPEWPGAFSIL